MILVHYFNILICIAVPTYSHFEKSATPPKLLMISFDGFRHDYIAMAKSKGVATPNFDTFLKKGVHSKLGLKNAFITKTFPNHYTLVTGLWEESHGIVANIMYDPNLDEVFTLGNKEDQQSAKWFDNGGEPIWVTNQLQNCGHRSGTYMYPGGSAPVKGVHATRHVMYDNKIKFETRIDKVLDWFTQKYPINLGLLYFEQPDVFGHRFGPNSPEITKLIGELDGVVGYLLKQFKEKEVLDDMNIVITSDHGFASTPRDKIINLDDYIDPATYRIFTSNPIGNILPNKGKLDEIYSNLTKASLKEKHFKVYKKENIPARYHYSHNDRIMPILIVPEDHWQLSHNGSTEEVKKERGNHGWDNTQLDMHPFFMAMGPTFKPGASVDVLDNVDVYPLLCHLLGLEAAPNNGSLNHTLSLLKRHPDEGDDNSIITFGTYILILIIIASVAGVFMVSACRQHRYLKRKQMMPLTSLKGTARYSIPHNGAKIPLLSDSDEDEDIIY